MNLYYFQLSTFKNRITLIPTIKVQIDNLMYGEKNIELIVDIFIWHFRWLFSVDKAGKEQE